jgi:hypothetical protein
MVYMMQLHVAYNCSIVLQRHREQSLVILQSIKNQPIICFTGVSRGQFVRVRVHAGIQQQLTGAHVIQTGFSSSPERPFVQACTSVRRHMYACVYGLYL